MVIRDLIWLEDVIDKLEQKHNVLQAEVTFVMNHRPYIRFISKGRRNKKESVYAAYGRAEEGRYLTVFFIYKQGNRAVSLARATWTTRSASSMARKVRDPIPEFETLEDIVDFWDTHSTADYDDVTHEVDFQIQLNARPKPKRTITLLPELSEKLQASASQQGVSMETLVNAWLTQTKVWAILKEEGVAL